MQSAKNSDLAPDESNDERASREFAKLIRKLRWIGSEEEANGLEARLRSYGRVCVLAEPIETD